MWFLTQSHSDERKIFAPFKRTQKCHTPIINSVLPRCRKMPLGSKMFYWATKCDTFIAFTSSQMKLFRGFHFFKEFLSRHVTCKPIHGYLYPIILPYYLFKRNMNGNSSAIEKRKKVSFQ